MATRKTVPKGRKPRTGLRSQVKASEEEAAWNSVETTEDEEGATSLPRVSQKSSPPSTKSVTPDTTAGEGMISLMRRFLNTQEQREERYLQELRGLFESITQLIHPAETSLDAESLRLELPTPAPKRQESQRIGLIRRCRASSRGKISRIIFGGSNVWQGPRGQALEAYLAMDEERAEVYTDLKEALLEKFNISLETYRQRFRSTTVPAGESPTETYNRLKNLYKRWVLPYDARTWVREHEPRVRTSSGKVGSAVPECSSWRSSYSTTQRRIAMDIVGPLEKSSAGHHYILVVRNYTTRYPEALPLCSITTPKIIHVLVQLFSRVGIPEEILTDQGTNFTSRLMGQLNKQLGITAIRTTPYHLQTDGLVERFNQTLKNILRKFVADTGRDWDKWLPFVLFTYREVPQASMGFPPFKLLYGWQAQGPLDLLKRSWEETPASKMEEKGIVQYVLEMRDHLERYREQAKENLQEKQQAQKRWYDQHARLRQFRPGQKVLLLLPTSTSKLLAKWQGPYTVVCKMGPVTYEVHHPDKGKTRQTYHVNLLKEWKVPPGKEPETGWRWKRKRNQRMQKDSRLWPGRTELAQHTIHLSDPSPSCQHPYRVPERLVEPLKEEIKMMKELGVIEPSTSEWSSPMVIVPKKDGSLRVCIDFRKLNAQSKFDAYPMPRVDDLLEKIGKARYITTLDLCKGNSWAEHLQHLQQTLKRIQEAGLPLNVAKCEWARQEANYLGYHLGNGQLRPQMDKVETTQRSPQPNTKKEVRSFLGLVGWYRRFVPNFASIAAPLTNLLSKTVTNPIPWTDDCETAFNALKDKMCSSPVLQSPDFSQRFLVQVDVSTTGIGVVLAQGSTGEERPVVYLSHKLLPRETRYSAIEKEGLAIKWSLDSLRYYLLGREFDLETDHWALTWIQSMKDHNARVTRWYLALQPYRFKIRH
ncbi:hypothetical protein M9458_051871 [Cirrhinus mrigala]|uniref:Integrase catalytic domain-containing protein n=1 Tax=Cirrhinus mrigala TaxID=683832 RepID=A0ABD0MV11_CIRMR